MKRKTNRRRVPRKPRAFDLLRRFKEVGDIPPINPDFFYRRLVCPLYLGLELTQLDVKIKEGEFPPFIQISESGRAQGYYGSQLLEIKAKRIAAGKRAA